MSQETTLLTLTAYFNLLDDGALQYVLAVGVPTAEVPLAKVHFTAYLDISLDVLGED